MLLTPHLRTLFPVLTVSLLAACASPVPPKPAIDYSPRLAPLPAVATTSFDCSGALPAVHRYICASETLSALDRQLTEQYRQMLQALDLPGALLLEANQRQWQLGRAGQCSIAVDQPPEPQGEACLQRLYQQRLMALQNWKPVPAPEQKKRHALASYAEFRLAEAKADEQQCALFARQLNADLAAHGLPSPARLPGVQMLASSHGPKTSVLRGEQKLEVLSRDAGLYAGYQQRAAGLTLNGEPLLDDRTLPHWVSMQPNYGGRAHVSSSQTRDYASIDVFNRDAATFVLVNEVWGFYSPAARGESAFAGLYRLHENQLQPLCLYQTYLTPPRTNTLAGLPAYQALLDELEIIAGDPLPEYAQHERRDNHQRWMERQWTLLNLPLLGADELHRYGRYAALQQRHDELVEMLFDWSERSIANKQHYRRVLPMLQPAFAELQAMYIGQGLSEDEALAASTLLFHATLARTLDNLATPQAVPDMPLAAFASYAPRYAIAPEPGALERGRHFSTLYSVLLNNAPDQVVNDFIQYETDTFGDRRGLGPDGNPALMAALRDPRRVAQLLAQGFAPDQRNDWGKTALMGAAQLNLTDSARVLLDAGADVHLWTDSHPGLGAGGPERREAEQGRQTALLLAARQADREMIELLLGAGAASQAWEGYHQQVCMALEANRQIDEQAREALKAPLCVVAYSPPPVTHQVVADIRAGDAVIIRDDGTQYRVTLQQRPAMALFGRDVQLSPKALRDRVGSMAVAVGTAAVRRARVRLEGPLTLVFDDLTQNSENLLTLKLTFPVSSGAAAVAGHSVYQQPGEQVLSVIFDAQRNDPEGTWRALYSAAYTQGFTPVNKGYVVVHTRGGSRSEYQLVVSE